MRERGRVTALATAAAAAGLLLSACSSSGTVGGAPGPQAGAGTSTGASTSTSTGASQPCTPTPANGDCGVYNGTWKGTTSGTAVTLTVTRDQAELKAPHDCPGSFDGQLLLLTCQDGNTDRQTGSATLSADHKTLTVSWDGGITDALTKS
ncbi:hypothetical protein ABH920_004731 [Catenulispora sp. EB89]|uniref:hypothetical protein n=1 Tax=Catenulispora sp. EB89 TaxID=3156257 RepID=UPI0035179BC0